MGTSNVQVDGGCTAITNARPPRPENVTTTVPHQALYTAAEWAGDVGAREGRSRAPDVAAYDRSVERLKALDPAQVAFAHDREVWTRPA